jgi:DNA-binding NtrC family response regulator
MLTQSASPQRASLLPYRALVVDDERMLRSLVCRALARTGFEVFEAANGRAALDLIRASDFELVVSDVQMPIMGGLELAEELKRERPELPVILVSGHFELSQGLKPADYGAFALLRKPFSIIELQRTALHAIDSGTSGGAVGHNAGGPTLARAR